MKRRQLKLNISRAFYACFALFAPLLFSGCLKDTIKELSDIRGVEMRPGVSLPLLSMNIGIKELYNANVGKGEFVEGSDRFLTFVLKNRDSLPDRQFISLPPIGLNYTLNMDPGGIAQFNAIGQYHNSFSNYAVIKVSNKEQLKRIGISEGRFDVFITSQFKHNITLVFTYPSITRNGKALVDTIYLNYAGISPVIVQKNIPLEGYDVNLDDGGISYNVIPYLFEIDLKKIPGNSVSVNDQIIINENINIARYKYLFGYLGKFPVLNFTDNNSLGLFDKQVDGSIFFRNPRINYTLHNSFGMPVTAQISNLRIIRGNGDVLNAAIDLFADTFTFPYPVSGKPGDIITTTYQLDSTNTGHPVPPAPAGASLAELLNAGPQRMMYDVQFTANYAEVIQDNILYDNSLFYSDSELELPMELRVKNYVLADKEGNDLQKNDGQVTVEWATLSAFAHNQLPMSGLMQVYYGFDSVVNGVDTFFIQDSLYNNPAFQPVNPLFLILPARLNADGTVDMSGTDSRNDVTVNEARYAILSKYRNTYFKVTLNTSPTNPGQPPFVKLHSDQKLTVKMGVDAKLRYRSDK